MTGRLLFGHCSEEELVIKEHMIGPIKYIHEILLKFNM
jgi:hypothetical protein